MRHVAGSVRGLRVEGFITDEIRVQGHRVSFQLAPLRARPGCWRTWTSSPLTVWAGTVWMY